MVFPQPPNNVLDRNDGVIDQGPERDGDAAQGHGVDGRPQSLEHQQSDNHRQRQGQ